MRHRRWWVATAVVAVAAIGTVTAVVSPWGEDGRRKPTAFPEPAGTREGRWAQDVEYLTENIERLHVQPWFRVSREAFLAQAKEVAGTAATRSDEEMAFAVQRLVASLGDGHTRIQRQRSDRFPVTVRWLDDGPIITEATDRGLVGHRVEAVDAQPMSRVVDRLLQSSSRENVSDERADLEASLISPWQLHVAGITSDPVRARLTLRGAAGRRVVDVRAQPAAQVTQRLVTVADPPPHLRARHRAVAWTTYLAADRAGYLRYDLCRDAPTFRRVAEEALRTAVERRARRFVVDLRYNSGGNSAPFTEFTRTSLKPALAQHPMQLVAITGKQTASSGFRAVVDLVGAGATTVGEPPGTRPNYFGNVEQFPLPNSRLVVNYPTQNSPVLPELGAHTTYEPTRRVPFTTADFLANRDPYLAAVLDDRPGQ